MPPSPGQALPLSLFPSTGWWASALQAEGPVRLLTSVSASVYNRYAIATANGPQELSVPLKGGRKQRLPLSELCIDYTHDWQRQHWGAVYSAYGRAPFFEHYGPELKAIIYQGYERLEALNRAGIDWLSREMRIPVSFNKPDEEAGTTEQNIQLPPYHQVFEDRWGFQANLSAIDLLMNEGPYGARYLRPAAL